MPNQNTKSNSKDINQYDAGDLHDAYSLSECDLKWTYTALEFLRKKLMRLKEQSKNTVLTEYHFDEIITHADMYTFLADSRHNFHADEAKRYEKEWEQLKGGAQ